MISEFDFPQSYLAFAGLFLSDSGRLGVGGVRGRKAGRTRES